MSSSAERRRFLLTRWSLAALVLTFVVIVASATMRHAQAVGCADWPACYGRIVGDAAAAAATTATEATAATTATAATAAIGIHIARILHRLAASGALLSIVAILVLARGSDALRRTRVWAACALAIALALAALGIVTPGASLPAVPLGNLLGGFLMLAVLGALNASVDDRSRTPQDARSRNVHALAPAVLAALFVQTFFGGLIGTQFALPACPTLDVCSAPADAITASNPFAPPIVVDDRIVPPPGAAALHALHRLLGGVIVLALLALAFALRRSHPRSAIVLAIIAIAEPLLGAMAIVRMPALVLTVLHNAVAALAVVMCARIAASRMAPRHT